MIGNAEDAAAAGSISVTVSGGAVTGSVPPIILGPLGTRDGTFHYTITFGAGVSGELNLWQIDGINPVSGFGTNGVLALSGSVDGEYELGGGRYIAQIRLINGERNVAFLRAVMEIWPGLSTAIVFEPTPKAYLDPSVFPANSGATLAAESTIGGTVIGSDSGEDEANAVSYTLGVQNIGNAELDLALESDSLFADVSWTVTAGTPPGGTGYGTTAISDFSVNNVLWVKVVSEDGSATRYYKFALYLPPLSNGAFMDMDTTSGIIQGTITWTPPSSVAGIAGYHIYYGSGPDTKLAGYTEPVYTVSDPNTESQVVPTNTALPSGAAYFLIYSYNSGGEDYPLCLAVPIEDSFLIGSYGAFAVISINGASPSGVFYSSPVLTVTGAGPYLIKGSGSAATDRIVVSSGAVTDIILEDVNINVSGTSGAAAFVMTGAAVNLTLGGTNTLRSGADKAGLEAPDGSTLVISESSTGSLSATGGSYGAGIGGGYSGAGGTITISGGTVTATGTGGAGIGGYGAAGTIADLSGNAVVFASSVQPTLPAVTNAIVFIGNTGTMYGNVTLGFDVTIPEGKILGIPAGHTLTIPADKTLLNNGNILVENGGTISGTVTGNQPIYVRVVLLDLTGKVTAPVTGAAPDTTINTVQYTGTVEWQTGGGASFSGNFVTGTAYQAMVTLTAKTGYSFAGVAADSFTHDGAASITSIMNGADSGTVTIRFPNLFATPAQYRGMASLSGGTITGNNAYAASDGDTLFKAGRTVILSPFKIAKYETTYELWYEVKTWAANKGYSFAHAGREGHDGSDGAAPTGDKTEPVTYINWRDVIVWCNAYSEMSGKEPVYYYSSNIIKDSSNSTACDSAVMDTAKNGYRLPTEAEWEYAARGGGTPDTTGSFVYTYAGSNTVGDVAWYLGNSYSGTSYVNGGRGTHPVGGKTVNTAGLYDMSGNVWEWCWDRYGSISSGTETDPSGPATSEIPGIIPVIPVIPVVPVIRGGCWNFDAASCTVAYRYYFGTNLGINFNGFRVVSR